MKLLFAQKDDIDGWLKMLDLVKDSFPGLQMSEYRRELEIRINNECALAAKENGIIIGGLLFSRETKEIEFLAVHPEFRRLGTAKALLLHMFELFPKGSSFSLTTYREGDPEGEAAREFYKRMGFTPSDLVTVFDYPCQKLTYTAK